MDYSEYLLEHPLIGFPRDIVQIKKEDGGIKVFYVNNQLIDPVRGDNINSPLHVAIRNYLKEDKGAICAELYRELSDNEKVLRHTFKSSK